jgi:DNA-binding NarL/FixJ family response regulator
MAFANQDLRKLRIAPDILLKLDPGDTNLTPREQVILAAIVAGLSSKEIARTLEISPRTVEFHRANVLDKCEAKNTADLVRKVLAK